MKIYEKIFARLVGYVNENLAKAKKGEKDYEVAIRDAVNRCIAEE